MEPIETSDGFEIRDDEDYEGGGFEDPNTNPAPTDDAPGDEDDNKPDDKDGDKPDDTTGDQDHEKEPEDDEQFALFRQLQQQNEQLTQAVVGLNAKIEALQKTPPQEAVRKPDEDEDPLDDVPMPTDADWAEDPNKASEMVVRRRIAIAERKLDQKVRERLDQVTRETAARQELKQKQEEAWAAAVKLCPELEIEGHPVRETARQILQNPDNGLAALPMGPWLAASSAMTVNGYVPQMAQESAKDEGRKQGAAAERDRQGRLKAGVMSQGGRGGGSTITMDAEHKRIARTMGVSEKAYLEALNAQSNG